MTQNKKKQIVDTFNKVIALTYSNCLHINGIGIYNVELVESFLTNTEAEIIFTVVIDEKRELMIMDDLKILELYKYTKKQIKNLKRAIKHREKQ